MTGPSSGALGRKPRVVLIVQDLIVRRELRVRLSGRIERGSARARDRQPDPLGASARGGSVRGVQRGGLERGYGERRSLSLFPHAAHPHAQDLRVNREPHPLVGAEGKGLRVLRKRRTDCGGRVGRAREGRRSAPVHEKTKQMSE